MVKLQKIIAGLVCAVMLLSNAAGMVAVDANAERIYGDANGDGRINLGDASLTLKLIAKWNVEADSVAADLNQNGKVDLSDVARLLRVIAWYGGELNVIPAKETVSMGDAFLIVNDSSYTSHIDGIASGWRFDNRGGEPKTDIRGAYGTMTDVSATEGIAMIKEMNRLDEGIITLETSVKVTGDGFSLEYRNDRDEILYRVFTDGGWYINTPDGAETLDINTDGSTAKFVIVVDLGKGSAETYINDTLRAHTPLLLSGDDANIMSFRYATNDIGTPTAELSHIRISANYRILDEFNFYTPGALTRGWQGEGAVMETNKITIRNGHASKSFVPAGGTVIADTEFRVSDGEDMTFSLGCDETPLVTFSADKDGFYANGEKIYEDYYTDMWYRVRLEANTDTDTAKVWLNGRVVAENVRLTAYTNHFDTVKVTGNGDGVVHYDWLRVFEKIIHDDYVPKPVVPEGEEDYIVGVNACSLWQEGNHFGWGTITPYSEVEPVLGYYDEAVPETADWEIKYMVEHGIDFQAFCWFAGTGGKSMFAPHYSNHLHDGYMYSEYSDYMKYCLIWEVQSGGKPNDMEAWKESFVPYFIENYFKDERYMTVDNMPLFFVYGKGALADAMGGVDVVREMFDYMEAEVQKLGFDGIVYVTSEVTSSEETADMGYDATWTYNWGPQSNNYNNVKNYIYESYTNGYTHFIPTVTTGYNTLPWLGERSPLMASEKFLSVHEWIRDIFFEKVSTADDWTGRTVMLATWNEYGEGTYIMPTVGTGFGYLDAVRAAYTSAGIDESINIVPTEAQKARITRMYPQYRRTLRRQDLLETDTGGIKQISIDGLTIDLQVFGEERDGRILVPFDPKLALDYRLGAFMTWDHITQTLILEFADHTAVYTVGKSTAVFDGAECDLGYTVEMKDGLPMLDLEGLCSLLGYGYVSDSVPSIDTGSLVSAIDSTTAVQ